MARGFESKDVEYQQAEHVQARATDRDRPMKPATPSTRRRSLELALAHARAELGRAVRANHQRMLTDAIHALEDQLRDTE